MVDLSHRTIRRLFEQQVLDLTRRTIPQEESFEYQLNGGRLR